SVLTPRSKTITGIPLSHACSTAGVNVAVAFGETITASQPRDSTAATSLIGLSSLASAARTVHSAVASCNSTSACMVFQPTCRHGLSTEALEKHRWYGPDLA